MNLKTYISCYLLHYIKKNTEFSEHYIWNIFASSEVFYLPKKIITSDRIFYKNPVVYLIASYIYLSGWIKERIVKAAFNRCFTSRYEEGSSNINISPFWTHTMAQAKRCNSPPESWETSRSLILVKSEKNKYITKNGFFFFHTQFFLSNRFPFGIFKIQYGGQNQNINLYNFSDIQYRIFLHFVYRKFWAENIVSEY